MVSRPCECVYTSRCFLVCARCECFMHDNTEINRARNLRTTVGTISVCLPVHLQSGACSSYSVGGSTTLVRVRPVPSNSAPAKQRTCEPMWGKPERLRRASNALAKEMRCVRDGAPRVRRGTAAAVPRSGVPWWPLRLRQNMRAPSERRYAFVD